MRKTSKHLPVQMDLFGNPIKPYRPESREIVVADDFRGNKVRRIFIDGEPHWVLSDVAKVLGYSSAKDAGRCLKIHHTKGRQSVPTPGGNQLMTLVTLAGLNHLIMRSDRPEAETFRSWVCDEVLPSIQKTGSYSVGKKPLDQVARIQKRLNCDRKTAIEREKSIGQSKSSHRLLMKLNAKPNDYKAHNNNIYVRMYSLTARQLRKLLGLKPWQSPMDRMSHFTLSQLSHAKALGDKIAEFQNVKDLGKRNEIIGECVSYVRDSDLSRLGAPGQCVLGIREDDRRGKVLDVLLRPLAS